MLSPRERKERERARRVGPGSPAKVAGKKADRYMVSIDLALHDAAVKFSRSAKRTVAGLIAGHWQSELTPKF